MKMTDKDLKKQNTLSKLKIKSQPNTQKKEVFMKLRFENIADEKIIKDKINEAKREIKLLEEADFLKKVELNENNLEKMREIKKAYINIVTRDWTFKPLEIVVANPDGTEIATIK